MIDGLLGFKGFDGSASVSRRGEKTGAGYSAPSIFFADGIDRVSFTVSSGEESDFVKLSLHAFHVQDQESETVFHSRVTCHLTLADLRALRDYLGFLIAHMPDVQLPPVPDEAL